ncbi:RNA polymerase II associated protein 1 [Entophlyctis sp. JEL0112]|nr:RNA polymerase II associated protein 1 [Entophlyctis sp. JEL0112]
MATQRQKRPSLFAERLAQARASPGTPIQTTSQTTPTSAPAATGADVLHDVVLERSSPSNPKFSPVNATVLERQIDNENNARIAAMSSLERADALNEIFATFSLDTINKFRALAEKKLGPSAPVNPQNPPVELNPASSNSGPSILSAVVEKLPSDFSTADLIEPITPPESESQKIKWMNPVGESELASASSDLRFSFDGSVIPFGQEMPSYLGLHHHGDDPARAGYTIKELVYLARSSVSSQRSISIQGLVAIVKLFMANSYSPRDIPEIAEALRAYMVLFHIRAAIDDASISIVSLGISGVSEILGLTGASSDILSRDLDRYTLKGHVLFEMSPSSLETISSKWSGRVETSGQAVTIDENMSNEEMSNVLVSDVVGSYAETHLLDRIHVLIVSRKLNSRDTEKILHILIRMARCSTKICTKICSTPGLVSSIRRSFLSIAWPTSNHSTLKHATLSLRLFQILIQASITNQAISHILESASVAVRFFSLSPEKAEIEDSGLVDLVYGLQTESFTFLAILFAYGSSTRLFFDLRNEFVNIAMNITREVKLNGSGKGIDVVSRFSCRCLAFWKMISVVSRLARDGSNEVGVEAISPIISVGVDLFHCLNMGSVKSSHPEKILTLLLIQCFADYVNLLEIGSQAFDQFVESIKRQDMLQLPMVRSVMLQIGKPSQATQISLENKDNVSKFIFGVPYINRELENAAISETVNCNLLEAAFSFDTLMIKVKQSSTAIDESCVNILQCLLSMEQSERGLISTDWAQIYGRGRNDLRTALLLQVCASANTSTYSESSVRNQIIVSNVMIFIRRCLPTDEDCFAFIFQILGSFSQLKEASPVALDILSKTYLKNGEPEGNSNPIRVKSLCISFRQDNLPAHPNWVFMPVISFKFNTEQMVATLLAKTLKFAVNLEKMLMYPDSAVNSLLKLGTVMKIYLLEPIQGREVFSIGNIPVLIGQLVEIYTSTPFPPHLTLETVLGSSAEFYKMYQALLSQYSATSFGDMTFTKLIVIPLASAYPHDYQTLFWNTLCESPHLLAAAAQGLRVRDAPGGFGVYSVTAPVQEGLQDALAEMYLAALGVMHAAGVCVSERTYFNNDGVDDDANDDDADAPFLWRLVITRLARAWFAAVRAGGTVVGFPRRVVSAITALGEQVCVEFVRAGRIPGSDGGMDLRERESLWNLAVFMASSGGGWSKLSAVSGRFL